MLSNPLFRAEPGRGDRVPRPAPGIWLLGLATAIARHVTGRWPGFGSRPYSFGVMDSYYFEGDQVRAARAGDDAHLRRPAGGREHIAGGAQVCGGEARAEPEPYLLTIGRRRGGQDERQPAAPGLDPGVHAARSDPVRRDEAPGPCDAPLAGWRPAQQRCGAGRQPGPRGDSESKKAEFARDESGRGGEGGENAKLPAPVPGQLGRSGTAHLPDGRFQAGHQAGVVRPAGTSGGHQRSPLHGQSGGA
jgi:hypothetical protein